MHFYSLKYYLPGSSFGIYAFLWCFCTAWKKTRKGEGITASLSPQCLRWHREDRQGQTKSSHSKICANLFDEMCKNWIIWSILLHTSCLKEISQSNDYYSAYFCLFCAIIPHLTDFLHAFVLAPISCVQNERIAMRPWIEKTAKWIEKMQTIQERLCGTTKKGLKFHSTYFIGGDMHVIDLNHAKCLDNICTFYTFYYHYHAYKTRCALKS